MLGGLPGRLRVDMVRAKGLEPPHLAILEPKSSASTNSATRARPPEGAAAYNRHGRMGNSSLEGTFVRRRRIPAMQQLPEEPTTNPAPDTPEPSQPGQPTEPPAEEPGQKPNIDVPSPSSPGTAPSPGPISPVG